ncbi:nucleoside hydrolase [Dyadobacter bucti]|uniref:nucleoside hydrolase n=1 Tax=Dyadobacter bucti TaxID=2572203 RepID=UPI0011081A42|nr:nucleoside hydrolase [Dyadobacter bucti]
MRNLPLVLAFALLVTACSSPEENKERLPAVILDTDIGPDYDDVGAMAVLHALADSGQVVPLAVIASNSHELVVPAINILNTYFGRPDLPTGAPKGEGVPYAKASQGWPELIAEKYPHTIKSSADAPDAVETYRKILSAQPDTSVTIVTVGFLTNMAALLESPADSNSKLSGKELVTQKVKRLVSMAGRFPKGREYNVFVDSVASEKVFTQWPTEVIFSGFEIGMKVVTGQRVIHNAALNSPVKDVYAKAMSFSKGDSLGRMSWDQTAVLIAVKGAEPYFGLQRGHYVPEGGNNAWRDDPEGPHAYMTFKRPVEEITETIENLMMHQKK